MSMKIKTKIAKQKQWWNEKINVTQNDNENENEIENKKFSYLSSCLYSFHFFPFFSPFLSFLSPFLSSLRSTRVDFTKFYNYTKNMKLLTFFNKQRTNFLANLFESYIRLIGFRTFMNREISSQLKIKKITLIVILGRYLKNIFWCVHSTFGKVLRHCV